MADLETLAAEAEAALEITGQISLATALAMIAALRQAASEIARLRAASGDGGRP